MTGPSSYGPFEVEFTRAQLRRIQELSARAVALGIGGAFAADLRAISERMRVSPRDWGDPIYTHPALQLIVYRGLHDRIAVTYGVHDRLPLVFVRDVRPILDHPLA
jgi:hypothetical protein